MQASHKRLIYFSEAEPKKRLKSKRNVKCKIYNIGRRQGTVVCNMTWGTFEVRMLPSTVKNVDVTASTESNTDA